MMALVILRLDSGEWSDMIGEEFLAVLPGQLAEKSYGG